MTKPIRRPIKAAESAVIPFTSMDIPLDVLEAKYGDDTDEEECMGGENINSHLPPESLVAGIDEKYPMEDEEDLNEETYYDEEEDEDSDEDVIAALEWADMRDGGPTY